VVILHVIKTKVLILNLIYIIYPKELAQVVRKLVLIAFSSGLRFGSLWVKTILWSQFVSEVGVLSDPCRGGALHGFEVCPTWIGTRNSSASKGFFIIKKKILIKLIIFYFLLTYAFAISYDLSV